MNDFSSSNTITSDMNRRLVFVTILVVIFASMVSTLYALVEINQSLRPELERKAHVTANSIHEDMNRALDAGIPFEKIAGVKSYLDGIVSKYDEFLYIYVTTPQDELVFRGGDEDFVFDPALLKNASLGETERAGQEDVLGHFSNGFMQLLSLTPFFGDHQRDVLTAPIELKYDGQVYGKIYIGLDGYFIRGELTNVFFDILIILVTVVLVSFEFILVMVMMNVSLPIFKVEEILRKQSNSDFGRISHTKRWGDEINNLITLLNNTSVDLQERYKRLHERVFSKDAGAAREFEKLGKRFNLQGMLMSSGSQASVIDARIPLFVFSFAEELQKSFMPLYVDELYRPVLGLSRDMIIGLPIAIFMFVIAAITPFAGSWADKFGNKRLFLFGLFPAITGYIGCALANDIYDVLVWRSSTAIGYAIITISCQGYIAAVVSKENRAKGMAVFVGVLMSATMCGTAIGGIIADRIGYHPVFFISAVFAACAGLLAWRMLSSDVRDEKQQVATEIGASKKPSAMRVLIKNTRFVALVAFCAIPTKIVLTGFFYYLIPLYLVSLGTSTAETGRIMMLYSFIIIPISPIAARFVDRTQKVKELVVFGSLFSGLLLVVFSYYETVWALVAAVALLGVAHGIIKAPLIAAVMEACEDEKDVGRTQVLGILRTSERVGSVMGPLLIGALLSFTSYAGAMGMLGGLILVITLAMFFIFNNSAVKQTAEG
ncbi:MFS transporter [Terasakiella pusilla]|uniref:MFS transporter n=1 Tax=Terasakiella pusilla TaxID=64973 RepID=UPI00068D37D9|nr:MFS transporter [Terasakiella pusilla]